MAGRPAPTAAPGGGVQGPGPRPAARLAVGVASGSIAASATAALRVLRFVIVAPFLWFNAMPPSLIPPRPVSSARPKPPDAGRVSRNFGPASRQTSEIPVTSSGWLITSACDEWEGMGAVYWTSRAANAPQASDRLCLVIGGSRERLNDQVFRATHCTEHDTGFA